MKYYPLYWDLRQWKSLCYRIYLNIFAVFLGFKFVPLAISKVGIDFWWKGDTVIWIFPWKRKKDKRPYISVLFSGSGEFGDCKYNTLNELDKDWEEYFNLTKEKGVSLES